MPRRRRGLSLVAGSFVVVGLVVSGCGGGGGSSPEAQAHHDAAAALIAANDFSGAVGEYTLAIEANPNSDVDYEGRGGAYSELGDYAQAVADFTKAIELAPGRGGPYFGRGAAYRQQGDFEAAITDLSTAIGDMTTTKWRAALYERGLAYEAAGSLAEARADFQKIVDLEAANPGEADASWADKALQELASLG